MDIPVKSTVLAVHIHIDGGVNHRVVKRCVEHCLLVVAALAGYDRQLLLPLRTCGCKNVVEAFSLRLCLKIAHGTIGTDGGESNFDRNVLRLVIVEIEPCHNGPPGNFREGVVDVHLADEPVVRGALHVTVAVADNRLGKSHGKIDIVLSRPSVGDAVSRNERVILHPD